MFSSPERIVPHGVRPPEQLFMVPKTLRPLGSAGVLRYFEPAAGPRTSNSVVMVIRRLYFGSSLTSSRLVRRLRSTTTTECPCASQAVLVCSSVGLFGSQPRNMYCSLVYSWLLTMNQRSFSPGIGTSAQ